MALHLGFAQISHQGFTVQSQPSARDSAGRAANGPAYNTTTRSADDCTNSPANGGAYSFSGNSRPSTYLVDLIDTQLAHIQD